jgi:Domain of unknown function DUF29
MGTNTDLYTHDFYAWSQTTAMLIRQGKWHEIDPEAVAEELESLGPRSELAQHHPGTTPTTDPTPAREPESPGIP